MSEIAKRILKTVAAKSAQLVLLTVVKLLSVPLFLSYWNQTVYGEWLIISTILVYFQIGKLGIAQTVANDMTISVAREERDKALSYFQSALLALAFVSFLIIALSLFLTFVVPVGEWLNIRTISNTDLKSILILYVGCVLATFAIGLAMAGYRCEELFHRGVGFVNAYIVLEFIGTVFVVINGGKPLHVAIVTFTVSIAVVFVMFIDLKRKAPWIKLGLRSVSINMIKGMITPSLSFAVFPLSQALTNQGLIIAIGKIYGPIYVVVFNAIRTLVLMIIRIYDLVNQAFYPEISIAWGKNKKELLVKLHRKSCQATLWLGILGATFLSIFGRYIFEIWTAGKVVYDGYMMNCLMVSVVVRSVWYASFTIPSAINRHQKTTIVFLVASIIGFTMSIVVMKYTNISYGLLCLTVTEIVMVFRVLRESFRITGDNLYGHVLQVTNFPQISEIRKLIRKERENENNN